MLGASAKREIGTGGD
jgi:hypothetical protein